MVEWGRFLPTPLVSDFQWERKGIKLDVFRALDPRGETIR